MLAMQTPRRHGEDITGAIGRAAPIDGECNAAGEHQGPHLEGVHMDRPDDIRRKRFGFDTVKPVVPQGLFECRRVHSYDAPTISPVEP